MFDETIQPYFEGANLKEEETTVHKRIFIAFSDLAVLIALKNQTLTGYGVNKYFLKKVGYTASPSTVYTTLVAIERKDWIKCVRNKSGRAYNLTDEGRKIVDNMDNIVRENKRFIDKLLS
jgi:DNA-binding PadR family transcriptional regulator